MLYIQNYFLEENNVVSKLFERFAHFFLKPFNLILEFRLDFTDESIKLSLILIRKGGNIGLLGLLEILFLYLLSLIIYLLIVLVCDLFCFRIDFLFVGSFSLNYFSIFLFLLHLNLILHSYKCLFHNIHFLSAFCLSCLKLRLEQSFQLREFFVHNIFVNEFHLFISHNFEHINDQIDLEGWWIV